MVSALTFHARIAEHSKVGLYFEGVQVEFVAANNSVIICSVSCDVYLKGFGMIPISLEESFHGLLLISPSGKCRSPVSVS